MRTPSRLALAMFLLSVVPVGAQTLSWDPSTTSGVTGYLVSYGPQSGFYIGTVDVGTQTSWFMSGLDPTLNYFFAVRAYTSDGSVSDYSAEVELPASSAGTNATVISQLQSSSGYPIMPGQTVTWTAAATSTMGSVEYAFWMFSQSMGWVKVQNYSRTPSFTWTAPSTDLGTHLLEVWARTVGSSETYETWMATGLFGVGTSSAFDSFTDTGSSTSTSSSSTSSTSTSSTSTCTTPDPFVSIGGGTCVNGGWIPGTSRTTTASTATTSTTASTSTFAGGCATPDPFAAIGGGACINGGWIPGGMTTTSTATTTGGSSSSTTSGTSATTSSSTSTTSAGCTTPDPFAAIGGGKCVNGGWIPGGMTNASTGASGSSTTASVNNVASTSTTSTTTNTSIGGCTIPDPFVFIGGGTCINGGWIPGHVTVATTSTSSSGGTSGSTTTQTSTPGKCTIPDPFVSIGGGVCVSGGWIPKRSGG